MLLLFIERSDFRIHFWFMTKIETVDRTKNTDSSKNHEQL